MLVGALGAAAVVVGANFTFGAKAAGDVAALHRLGTELGFAAHGVPLLQVVDAPCSSTYTRRCLRDGDLDAVARALGRPHRIDGHRSGELIEVAAGTALPPPGRYAATVAGRPATLEVTGAQELRVVAGRRVGKGPVAVTLHGRA